MLDDKLRRLLSVSNIITLAVTPKGLLPVLRSCVPHGACAYPIVHEFRGSLRVTRTGKPTLAIHRLCEKLAKKHSCVYIRDKDHLPPSECEISPAFHAMMAIWGRQ